ncbi:MAG: hypothetical protein U1E70_08860 [Acetobacteraceae bacterium]
MVTLINGIGQVGIIAGVITYVWNVCPQDGADVAAGSSAGLQHNNDRITKNTFAAVSNGISCGTIMRPTQAAIPSTSQAKSVIGA